jgi:hypothetical protein
MSVTPMCYKLICLWHLCAIGPSSPQSKPRKLRSQIWSDMVPIYQRGRVVRAQCKHCNEVFSAARNSGNSHMRRHLNLFEPRLKMHAMVEKLQSILLSSDTAVLTNWKFDKTFIRCELVRLSIHFSFYTRNVPVRCYGHYKIDIAKHKAFYHIMIKLANHYTWVI